MYTQRRDRLANAPDARAAWLRPAADLELQNSKLHLYRRCYRMWTLMVIKIFDSFWRTIGCSMRHFFGNGGCRPESAKSGQNFGGLCGGAILSEPLAARTLIGCYTVCKTQSRGWPSTFWPNTFNAIHFTVKSNSASHNGRWRFLSWWPRGGFIWRPNIRDGRIERLAPTEWSALEKLMTAI